MKTASSLLTIVASTLLSAACASDEPEQSKAIPPEWLPELPLTVERIEAFVDPEDLALLKQTSSYKKNGAEFFFRKSKFFEEYGIYNAHYFLVPFPMKAAVFWGDNRGEWESRLMAAGGPTYPGWGPDGRLRHHVFFQMDESDFELLNQFKYLELLHIREEVMEGPLDLKSLSPNLPLKSLVVSTAQIVNPNELCKYSDLEFVEFKNIRFYGDVDTQGCPDSVTSIHLANSQIDAATIQDLPGLKALQLSWSNIGKLVIKGSTLPNLKSIALEEANLPEDLSQVELPEGLMQLTMNDLEYTGTDQLQLPENLAFLDVAGSKLDDYQFITRAKHLKHLDLSESNFSQWSLLAELEELEHLRLVSTNITDEDLVHLSNLKSLQTRFQVISAIHLRGK